MSDLKDQSLILEAALFLRDFSKALAAGGYDARSQRAKFLADELKKLAEQRG